MAWAASSPATRPARVRPMSMPAETPGTCGDEDYLGARQPAEHLVGADRVEDGEPVVEQDGDLHNSPCRGALAADGGGMETAAVLPRADAEGADEGPAHRLRRAVPAG